MPDQDSLKETLWIFSRLWMDDSELPFFHWSQLGHE
jgi:hypothetical protein